MVGTLGHTHLDECVQTMQTASWLHVAGHSRFLWRGKCAELGNQMEYRVLVFSTHHGTIHSICEATLFGLNVSTTFSILMFHSFSSNFDAFWDMNVDNLLPTGNYLGWL